MEIAKEDGSGLFEEPSVGILGGGTGMYVLILDRRDCFWTECSGNGPFGVWMLTARPLKQGILHLRGDRAGQYGIFDKFKQFEASGVQ